MRVAALIAGLLLSSVALAQVSGTNPTQPPTASGSMPPAAALDSVQGNSMEYARADHTHAVRVQRTRVETSSDGTATWTFVRPIVLPAGRFPIIANMIESGGLPITVQVTGWTSTTDGTNTTFTSVTVQAQQARALPGLLLNLTALLNYVVFQNAGAGVKVHLWAADPTQ